MPDEETGSVGQELVADDFLLCTQKGNPVDPKVQWDPFAWVSYLLSYGYKQLMSLPPSSPPASSKKKIFHQLAFSGTGRKFPT